jgi:hypothetical protein
MLQTKKTKADLLKELGYFRPPVNRYGVDCDYFRKNLRHIVEHMDSYTPDELSRSLRILSGVAAHPGNQEAT